MSQLKFCYVLVIMGRNTRIVMEERPGSSTGDQTVIGPITANSILDQSRGSCQHTRKRWTDHFWENSIIL
jgi:hypothetical protein